MYKKIFIVIAFLLLVLISTIYFKYRTLNINDIIGAEKSTKPFLTKIFENDPVYIYDNLLSQKYKNNSSIDKFKAYVENDQLLSVMRSKDKGLKDISINGISRKYGDNYIVVSGTALPLDQENGMPSTFFIFFINENGNYKVDSFTLMPNIPLLN